jgi:transcriptional regulator with XRE-family HTH domain
VSHTLVLVRRTASLRGKELEFGAVLRRWRITRRMSQLALATDAEISARHVCFLETGRATPSRDMVELLASVLRVPLADRNVMLAAAGYAPAYAERALEATAVQHVRRAFEFILRQQEPYPAFVIDGQWNIIMRNDAVDRIFGLFRTTPGLPLRLAGNALHALCHPDGLRRFIVNWEEFAGPLIQTLQREAAERANPAAGRLRDEVLAYPGMPSQFARAASGGMLLPGRCGDGGGGAETRRGQYRRSATTA